MKSKILLTSALVIAGGAILFSSCSKDEDTTAPVVTINGASSVVLSLGATYTDPGATASDAEDGTVSVSSNFSSTNPNLNYVNSYTITYTATDAAGNSGSATRTVRIKNDAEDYEGTYAVVDTVDGTTVFNYSQIITVDNVVNNRLHFNKFADYANNTTIIATKRVDGNIEIGSQTATGIGTSAGGSCDVADHTFQSVGFSTVALNGFFITYTDDNLCNPGPVSTCKAHFSK